MKKLFFIFLLATPCLLLGAGTTTIISGPSGGNTVIISGASSSSSGGVSVYNATGTAGFHLGLSASTETIGGQSTFNGLVLGSSSTWSSWSVFNSSMVVNSTITTSGIIASSVVVNGSFVAIQSSVTGTAISNYAVVGASAIVGGTLTVNAEIRGQDFAPNIVTVISSGSYIVRSTETVILSSTTAKGVTFNLPASYTAGRLLEIKKVDVTTGTITVLPNGTQLIESTTSFKFNGAPYELFGFRFDGTNWWVW